jgi:VanZ family protein
VENFYKKLGCGLPAVMIAGAIFYASSLERIELPLNLFSFDDLLYHAATYLLFGIALMIAAYPWNTSLDYPLQTYIILTVIGILYGLSDEIHQSFVPNRSCTVSDFLADCAGLILALGAGRIWIKKKMAFERRAR